MKTPKELAEDFAEVAAEQMKGLLLSRWSKLESLSKNSEAGGKASTTFKLDIDFNGKMPEGGVTMKFAEAFKLDAVVKLPDPDQQNLPI